MYRKNPAVACPSPNKWPGLYFGAWQIVCGKSRLCIKIAVCPSPSRKGLLFFILFFYLEKSPLIFFLFHVETPFSVLRTSVVTFRRHLLIFSVFILWKKNFPVEKFWSGCITVIFINNAEILYLNMLCEKYMFSFSNYRCCSRENGVFPSRSWFGHVNGCRLDILMLGQFITRVAPRTRRKVIYTCTFLKPFYPCYRNINFTVKFSHCQNIISFHINFVSNLLRNFYITMNKFFKSQYQIC